jgi:polyphosphate kinase 2
VIPPHDEGLIAAARGGFYRRMRMKRATRMRPTRRAGTRLWTGQFTASATRDGDSAIVKVKVKKRHHRDAAIGNGDSAAPNGKLKTKDYETELKRLHVELVKLQEWVRHKGLKVAIVFEGRDGAGKGGTIKAITERVSPRVFRVVALPAPTDREKTQMYMQRYVRHLPAAGEVVIFDRSWYNRAGVERVMGFCSEEEVKKFLFAVPLLERAVVDSGIVLLKYWLEVSEEEQTRRLEDRIEDGRKIWKLSPMDLDSYSRWYDYSRARDEMFQATDTQHAPWYVAGSDDKRRARLNIISHLLDKIPYKNAPREKVKLPDRQKARGYKEPDYPYKYVDERY